MQIPRLRFDEDDRRMSGGRVGRQKDEWWVPREGWW